MLESAVAVTRVADDAPRPVARVAPTKLSTSDETGADEAFFGQEGNFFIHWTNFLRVSSKHHQNSPFLAVGAAPSAGRVLVRVAAPPPTVAAQHRPEPQAAVTAVESARLARVAILVKTKIVLRKNLKFVRACKKLSAFCKTNNGH